MLLERFSTFYRSRVFQIIVVGLVTFCELGIWMAVNNLGAGGSAKVRRPVSVHPRLKAC